jgi:hypothetical protein
VNRTFRALTTVVSIDIEDALACSPLLDAVIATYPTTNVPADVTYRLERRGVWRNGLLLEIERELDLVPRFELDLYEQVIARASAGWLLHAAAIEVDGQALVLAGASGAGKTTMTLALVARGHRLLTEEIVWIDAAGTVRGLSRSLHVVETSVQPIPAHWSRVPYPLRTEHGLATHLLAIPSEKDVMHDALPLAALVGLTHGPDRIGGLERFTQHAALQRFWDTTLRLDDEALRVATAVLRKHPAYRLASTSFEQAMAEIAALLATRNLG